MNQRHEEIDSKLQTPGQLAVKELVGNLPQEQGLSLSWRSQLNDKLRLTEAKVKRKRRFMLFARPVAGLSAIGACALAALVLMAPKPVTSYEKSTSIEASVVKAHQEQLSASEVTGTSAPTDDFDDAVAASS